MNYDTQRLNDQFNDLKKRFIVLRGELNKLQAILVTANIVCGDCYLHGERPGKHEGPCIEEEITRIKKERDTL